MKKIFMMFAFLALATLLVACGSEIVEPEPSDDGELTWSGLEDESIVRGDVVDLLEGVMVTDSIDGDLTSEIEITDDGGFSTHFSDVYTVTYQVENSTGVIEEQTKSFSVTIGHNLANNDFEMNNTYGWTVDEPGGDFDVTFEDGKANVSISNAGSAWWALQLYQSNIIFKENTTYKVTVNASSPQGHALSVGFEDPNDGFSMLMPGTLSMPLAAEGSTYELYYTADKNYSNVKVVIYLGYQQDGDLVVNSEEPHMVSIEDIYIEEVNTDQSVTFSGLDEVVSAASGSYTLDLTEDVSATLGETDVTDELMILGAIPKEVRDAGANAIVQYVYVHENGHVSIENRIFDYYIAKEGPHSTVNGDFDGGMLGWVADVNQTDGTGEASFADNGDGTVSILVTNESTAGWHIQLQQEASELTAGQTYRVFIRIKASAERTVTIEVNQPSAGFRNLVEPINPLLTTEYQEFELIFTADSDLTAKVAVLLGKNGSSANDITVTVDTFQVYLYEDNQVPTIEGALDLELTAGDAEPNWLADVYATDDISKEVNVTVKENLVDLNTPGEYTLTYSAIDLAGNEAEKTITVTVHEAADDAFVWSGMESVTVLHSDSTFDLLADVVVLDSLGEDISSSLTINDNDGFDVYTTGSYEVVYAAENANGTVYMQTRTVVVGPRFKAEEENFDQQGSWVYDRIDASITDGVVTVTFDAAPGGNPWDHQLYQNSGVTLEAGHTYQIEVRVKSSVARTIRAWVEDAANGYSGIATDGRTESQLEADTWTIITYTIEVTDAIDTTNAKLVVMLGAAGEGVDAHTVDIDYFIVSDITDLSS